MTTTSTIAVNKGFKTKASQKLKKKGIPLSVAVNMFLKKIADDEMCIDFMNNNDITAQEITVNDKKIAKLMDKVGGLYSNEVIKI